MPTVERDPIARLLSDYEVVDLSHYLEEGMPSFPTHSRFFHELWESYWHGDVAVAYQLIMNEHSGTHVTPLGTSSAMVIPLTSGSTRSPSPR